MTCVAATAPNSQFQDVWIGNKFLISNRFYRCSWVKLQTIHSQSECTVLSRLIYQHLLLVAPRLTHAQHQRILFLPFIFSSILFYFMCLFYPLKKRKESKRGEYTLKSVHTAKCQKKLFTHYVPHLKKYAHWQQQQQQKQQWRHHCRQRQYSSGSPCTTHIHTAYIHLFRSCTFICHSFVMWFRFDAMYMYSFICSVARSRAPPSTCIYACFTAVVFA